MEVHAHWMQRCLALAKKGAGAVSPNPLVGCVLVSPENEVLAEGWHKRFGGPHAEVEAIYSASQIHTNQLLRSCTLYVNMEPCSHYGKTPPCADLILKHGIPRVVTGMKDPNPIVAGTGIQRLRAHGVEVIENVLEHACKRLNEPFTHHLGTSYPHIHLKIAQTLDGSVATASGHSKWVTGSEARKKVHLWRASHDAVLVGYQTARNDNPALTVRHVEGRQPIRVVLDRMGQLPDTLQIFRDGLVSKTWVVVAPGVNPVYAELLHKGGGKLVHNPVHEGHLALSALFRQLGHGGLGQVIQSVLVEAGPGLATALMQEDLVDRLSLFIAPKLVGDGVPSFRGLGISTMSQAIDFNEHKWEQIGHDLLFTGWKRTV
ncbi:MAG: bifunctional diaminohydroxyphosphoribosylaminopyrimidine deaminase/5-amino-6-(5-phosphoribosylamino)uracil reductase RibD [Bacteroidetes Order II. Incertae sedis bacterium]|nr:bifunctional diaminohydroxyphosphoribosylaminopyrimidine deaminase/5-amino-6-(5-phosphoribosylamino)uracil reductase RibD [Bacteroidetes Order II. bacterium]